MFVQRKKKSDPHLFTNTKNTTQSYYYADFWAFLDKAITISANVVQVALRFGMNFLKVKLNEYFMNVRDAIAQQLYDEGIETNKRVVAILMRELTLSAKVFHRRKPSYR